MRKHLRAAWTTLKRPRWAGSMALAVASDVLSFGLDALGFGLGMIVQEGVDLLTALGLIFLLGFRWTLAIPLVVEAFPGLALFPTWTLAVAFYAAAEKEDPAPDKTVPR